MAATIQHEALAHHLLTAYCPRCARVVESQVLTWYSPYGTDGMTVQPLSPDVLTQISGGCLLWMHVPCRGVLVQVWVSPIFLAPIE